MVGLVADIIAVGLLANTMVGLHATHGGLPFFCTSLMLLVFVLSIDRHHGSLGIELIFFAWFCFNRIGCII
jgi:hypothetical protein